MSNIVYKQICNLIVNSICFLTSLTYKLADLPKNIWRIIEAVEKNFNITAG